MLERSVDGAKNRKLFLDYDVLVIIEANPDRDAHRSSEEKFWKCLVETLTGLRARIMKCGSKPRAIDYGTRLDGAGEKAYVCALDRDVDDLWSPYTYPANTILTYGYSYESDCIYPESISRSIELSVGGFISGLSELQARLIDRIELALKRCRFAVLADQISLQRGHGYFPRESRKFQRLLRTCTHANCVVPKYPDAKARLAEIRPQLHGQAKNIDTSEIRRRCYGKLLLWLAYEAACVELRQLSPKARLQHDFFFNVVVDCAVSNLGSARFPLHAYYSKAVATLKFI